MRISLESKGSCPKGVTKSLCEENWLRYDEPSLRLQGNTDLFKADVTCYTEDKLWDILRAKGKFPQGLPELAAVKLPSNDFISYVLKVNTVFRRTVIKDNGERIKVVFLSNLTKQEILDKLLQ